MAGNLTTGLAFPWEEKELVKTVGIAVEWLMLTC